MSLTGSGRFELRGQLGRGAFGDVWRAYDRDREHEVALKSLRQAGPDALLRFKNEFRALQDLQHPNVVHFYELFEDEGDWFFTMELVEGVNLPAYLWPRDRDVVFDEDRLRSCVLQLLDALSAIHDAGLTHRDIKPANVRVTPEGVAILLDFGLVVLRPEDESAVVGTPAYMAPEQTVAGAVGPPSDLYALGVLLFEMMTRELPFAGSALQIIGSKNRKPAPSPSILMPELPSDLTELCEQLLARNPSERPRAREAQRRLRRGSRPPSSGAPVDPAFVGRAAELEVIRRALHHSRESGFTAVVIEGPSGQGKSALARAFSEELGRSTVVLRGRCYEHERVPFKAFDGVVDELAGYLRRLSDEAVGDLVPERAQLLTQIFPVLEGVDAIANAPALGSLPVDALELREQAFEALSELLRRIGERRPLVLMIDDLQWADAESLLLLNELPHLEQMPALLVATVRPQQEECSADVRDTIGGLLKREGGRHILLSGLSRFEAMALAEQLLQITLADEDAAVEIATQAAGHPLFIAELVRYAQRAALQGRSSTVDLRSAIRARLVDLDYDSRRLVMRACLAGRPLDLAVACHDGPAAEGVDRLVKGLRVGRLLRTSRRAGEVLIEPFHDAVREAALDLVDPTETRKHHLSMASALQARDREADAEALVHHLRAAGEPARAAAYCIVAGDRAMAALAFHQAAALYRDALELDPSLDERTAHDIRLRLADALRQAGRGAEAATMYEGALSLAPESDARRLKLLAAKTYLQSGQLEQGQRLAFELLRELDIAPPRNRAESLLRMLYHRGRAKWARRRDARGATATELEKMKLVNGVASALSMVDFIHGVSLQALGTRLALQSGDRAFAARAVATEAAALGCTERPPFTKSDAMFHRARRLVDELGDEYTRAWLYLNQAASELAQYRFEAALSHAHEADRVFRDKCTGVPWELSTAHHIQSMCFWCMGRYEELNAQSPRWAREARERSDLYGVTTITASGLYASHLASDSPEEGIRLVENAMEAWNQPAFQIQHYLETQALTDLTLYAGRPQEAAERVRAMWPAFRRSLLPTLPSMRFVMCLARARTTLARISPARPDMVMASDAAKDIARARAAMPQAVNDGVADQAEAAVAAALGELERARHLLYRSERPLRDGSMTAFAAASKLRRGQITGGAKGKALVDAATDELLTCGLKNPERYVSLRVPGPF